MFTNDFFKKLETKEFEALLISVLRKNAEIRAEQPEDGSMSSMPLGMFGLVTSLAPRKEFKSGPNGSTLTIW